MPLDPLFSKLLLHCGYPLQGTQVELLEYLLGAFRKIPYENLSKIVRHADSIGSRHKESPDELVQGFIEHGSGGTCFPLTYSLVHFLVALGFEAHPILADRRYGQDTHCAVIFRHGSERSPEQWRLLDPGYLIFSPCEVPTSGTALYELVLSSIELRRISQTLLELYTSSLNPSGELNSRYRLTYKLHLVDPGEFMRAWERSFDWEMMTYPIVSAIAGDSLVYLQKNTLLLRSRTTTTRVTLTDQQIIEELSSRLGVSRDVVKRALASL